MKSIKLKSGNTLNFQLAPIKDAVILFRTVISCFTKRGINLDMNREIQVDGENKLNFGKIFLDNANAFIGGLADIVCYEGTEEAILKLCDCCNYEVRGRKERITQETFEDIEARQDYFEVLFLVAKENLLPFFPKTRI